MPLLPSLLRHCLLHCCAAAPFIVTPLVLPSSLRPCGLRHRAAAPFLVALLVLPLSLRCHCLRHCAAAGSAFVVAPPPVLHLSSRRRCLHCQATAAFLVAPPLPSLLRCRGMVKWRNGRMAEWRNGGVAEWHNGGMGGGGMMEWRMAEWWNGGKATYQIYLIYLRYTPPTMVTTTMMTL